MEKCRDVLVISGTESWEKYVFSTPSLCQRGGTLNHYISSYGFDAGSGTLNVTVYIH